MRVELILFCSVREEDGREFSASLPKRRRLRPMRVEQAE